MLRMFSNGSNGFTMLRQREQMPLVVLVVLVVLMLVRTDFRLRYHTRSLLRPELIVVVKPYYFHGGL